MPNKIVKRGAKWCVVEISTNKVKSCHDSKQKAYASAAIREREAKKG